MVMMVVMSLYTVVDGMFVSRLVGTDAFSAVNIVYPLLSFVIALGTMFGTGITAIVSRKLGEGKQQEACENVTFITLFAVGLGILMRSSPLSSWKRSFTCWGQMRISTHIVMPMRSLCFSSSRPIYCSWNSRVSLWQTESLTLA